MRIGIFGGTFDPVHLGHINLAAQAIREARLDKLIFVPAKVQPFKQDQDITPEKERLEMLKLAIEGMPKAEISTIELEREDISYTVTTLRQFKKEMPGADLFFLIGADAFLKIFKWNGAAEILSEHSFLVGTRPGYKEANLQEVIGKARILHNTKITRLNNEEFDINSTEIRRRAEVGESIDHLVPAPVVEYIKSHGLYKNERILDYISVNFSEKRKIHTFAVAKEAMKLAERYGADVNKAKTAALFHDMYRGASESSLNLYVKHFGLDKHYMNNANLAHAKIAAIIMERDFGIHDEDLINAVKYHTTGRCGMSKLEKIIFLADAVEPNREYEGVDELRKRAYQDLDQAVLFSLESTIAFVEQKGVYMDKDTLEARDYIKEGLKEKLDEQ